MNQEPIRVTMGPSRNMWIAIGIMAIIVIIVMLIWASQQ